MFLAGPLKAPTCVGTMSRFDYQPDKTILILSIMKVQINGIVSIGCVEDNLVNRHSYRSNSIL